jgi:hypothetical protein
LSVALAGALFACTATRRPPDLALTPARPRPAGFRGASFRYHPQTAAPMLATVALEGGALLWAGRRGERWLFDPRAERLSAALPAPEDLVAVTRDPGGGQWFVGRSGASYHALAPLAAFVDVTVPLAPLAQVSASGRTLLGVGRDQRLTRSADDGRTWAPAGPPGTAFVDVALDAHGRALALASPEALFESDDAGATFRPSDLRPSGALALVTEPSGNGIRIVSLLGTTRFGGNDAGANALPELSDVLKRGVPLPLGEDAGSLVDDEAALSSGRYLELRAGAEGKREWEVVSGPFGGPLVASPLPAAKGCAAVKLASFERYAYFACFRAQPGSTQRVELYESTDSGRSFARVAPDFWSRLGRFRIAAGREGALVLSGVCPPNIEGPGCGPSGIVFRRAVPPETATAAAEPAAKGAEPDAASGFELAPARVPSLSDNGTVELAFGADGRTAFALAESTKGATLTLFTSRDRGQSFEAHELGDATRDQDMDSGVPLTPGRDGTLSLLLGGRRGASSLVVVDADGHVLHAGTPPERSLLGAAGLSALAVGAETGAVFESLDGGVSWQARGKLPIAPCPGDAGCDVPVVCGGDGCVIGNEFTRVGWGDSDEPLTEAYAPVDTAGEMGVERRLATPVACALAPGGWHALAGVRELPDADQAAIGDTAWFALAEDGVTGAVRAHHGHGGPHPKVDTVELLPPLARPGEYAQDVTAQIEGAAAIRYHLPDSRAAGGRLRDVELAWDNLFENRLAHAVLPDAGLYTPGDFERGPAGGVEHAKPDLVSIAEHGIYVRAHTRTRADQPTYFLDGSSVVSIPPLTWPSLLPRSGHAEMAHLGSEHVGLMLLARGGAMARARLEGGSWKFDAASVGLPDPEAFGTAQIINITYLNGQAALHVEELDERGRRSEAHVYALNGQGPVTGPPIVAPTELDLGATPAACTRADRATTARLVTRGYPGTHHPVVVSDQVEPPRAMLTGDAVLYGTKAAPCAAAFELHSAPGGGVDPATTEGGVLLVDDLAHAWLFRRTREGGEGARVEYRSMSCRFDPNLELPEEILNAPEALAPKR